MADPVYTLGIELQTGSFTNVTTRVERGSWGQTIVDMFNPPRVGRAMFELANDDGLMGPRVNSSFQPGRNIQLTVVCSAITYALFYGKITDISLRSTLGARTTIVEAEDDWARLQDIRWTTKLYSGTNVKSLFSDLMSLTNVRSFQIDATNIGSDHNILYLWYRDAPAVESIHELVSAGNYQLLVDGAGTYQLRGRNWSRFDASSTPIFDVSSWATAFRSSMSRNSIYNRIRVSGEDLFMATDLCTIVYMPTGNPYTFPASTAIGFVGNYEDPVLPRPEVPCGSVVAMVQSTDWYFSQFNDGSGADMSSGVTLTTSLFGASYVATYTNNQAVTVYLARSQIRGYPMRPIGALYSQVDIASSQTQFGIRAFSMQNRILQWQASDYIRSLATHIASDRKDGMHEAQLTLTNQFWTQYLNDSLGNIIYVIDPFSGVPTTWRTRATTHDLDLTQGLRHATTYELDTPQGPMGWGTPDYAATLVVAGYINGDPVDLYNLSTLAWTTGGTLSRSGYSWMAAVGDLTVGIFSGGQTATGYGTTVNEKYTYATNGVSTCTALGTARYIHGAAGHSTVGLFASGQDQNAALTAVIEKYTYSTDVIANGTNIGTARQQLAGCGDGTRAIFGAGRNPTIMVSTEKYTYSGDVVAAGTNLSKARYALAASGSLTVGIFGGGQETDPTPSSVVTDQYTYATDVVAASTNLSNARYGLSAAGTHTFCAFIGGYKTVTEAIQNTVDHFTFASQTVASGTNTAKFRFKSCATSSIPGGF